MSRRHEFQRRLFKVLSDSCMSQIWIRSLDPCFLLYPVPEVGDSSIDTGKVIVSVAGANTPGCYPYQAFVTVSRCMYHGSATISLEINIPNTVIILKHPFHVYTFTKYFCIVKVGLQIAYFCYHHANMSVKCRMP